MKRHWNGIMNYIRSRISNGVLESINSIVQSLKTSARGYRNIENFMTMILHQMWGPSLQVTHIT